MINAWEDAFRSVDRPAVSGEDVLFIYILKGNVGKKILVMRPMVCDFVSVFCSGYTFICFLRRKIEIRKQ